MGDITEKITLQAIEHCDLEAMKGWRNKVIENMREYRLINMEHQERWWKEYSDQAYGRYPKNLMFMIRRDAFDGDRRIHTILVGVCGWTNIDWLNRRAELSIYIAPSCQRLGYGELALAELHKIGFDEYGFKAVWLEVHDWNEGAMRLYEKVGYKKVGEWRNARFKGGLWYPTHIYDFTEEDYRKCQSS